MRDSIGGMNPALFWGSAEDVGPGGVDFVPSVPAAALLALGVAVPMRERGQGAGSCLGWEWGGCGCKWGVWGGHRSVLRGRVQL